MSRVTMSRSFLTLSLIGAEVTEVTGIAAGVQARMRAAVDVKDSQRPAAVAECLIRFYS